MKMLAVTRERTLRAREIIAAQTLSWENVELKIRHAAGAGAVEVMIQPDVPTNIRDTAAGKSMFGKLHRYGFGVRWERLGLTAGHMEWFALVIDWRER